jgi:hypothetical protein
MGYMNLLTGGGIMQYRNLSDRRRAESWNTGNSVTVGQNHGYRDFSIRWSESLNIGTSLGRIMGCRNSVAGSRIMGYMDFSDRLVESYDTGISVTGWQNRGILGP